jgi:hypothetical protein
MGKQNSSLTRVKPIFDSLYKSDRSGASWLLRLLRLASLSGHIEIDFQPGGLLHAPLYQRPCPPPREFLRFLLSNPSKLAVPPDKDWREWSSDTQVKRRKLLDGDPATKREGLAALDAAHTLTNPFWWRLEGVTYVDCALLTKSMVVFIEGKRTEGRPSPNVTWWKGRNQVIRNVECAWELARETGRSKAFVLLIVEEGLPRARFEEITNPDIVAASLPHRDEEDRTRIMSSYLGSTTWQAVVHAMGLDPALLLDSPISGVP